MESLLDLARGRGIQKFTSQEAPTQEIEELLEAAGWAPSRALGCINVLCTYAPSNIRY